MPDDAGSIPATIMRRRWRDLRGDRGGAAIIEFALCGAMFIALLLAALNVALIFFAQQGLQTAAETVGRKVLTGQITASNTTQANFRNAACAALPPFMKCGQLYVDLRNASSFGAVDTSRPSFVYDKNGTVTNNWSYSPGDAGSVVVLRLLYVWPVSKIPLGVRFATEANGTRVLVGTMVFKTEPYS